LLDLFFLSNAVNVSTWPNPSLILLHPGWLFGSCPFFFSFPYCFPPTSAPYTAPRTVSFVSHVGEISTSAAPVARISSVIMGNICQVEVQGTYVQSGAVEAVEGGERGEGAVVPWYSGR
jgi:hypothetical protein